ncbi:unnamed protein product [Paramecium sonneborni]|uniref:Uncharacterized protein n=1 Tax=Paramecium sonneborni TaxID=65129 RepID=A0A8S1RAC2_9CILI|nr:unnamed protein product [Paramecium sonneborni]
MQNQQYFLLTPSTHCTASPLQREHSQKAFQKQSYIYPDNQSEGNGIKVIKADKKKESAITIYPDSQNSIKYQNSSHDELNNIYENLKFLTQQCEQKSNELNVLNQRLQDFENKWNQLQQKNLDLEEELRKQKQISLQMENFSKELEKKLQVSITTTEIHCSIENLQIIIRQKENQIQELQQLLEIETEKVSMESDRLIKEFKVIFEEQKRLNQKLLQENIQLQKEIKKIAKKQKPKLLDEQQLRQIVSNYYLDNNEECLLKIPDNQYLKAIKILRETSYQLNTNNIQQNQMEQKQENEEEKTIKQLNLKELKDKQQQLITEIKNQMGKFIDQKEHQQDDISQFQYEVDELKKELEQVENVIQEIQQNQYITSHKYNVSFENTDFN